MMTHQRGLRRVLPVVFVVLAVLGSACRKPASQAPAAPASRKPVSILLVTLDTTRADAVGPDNAFAPTPAFNGIAAGGRRFLAAYATVPETLPSHASMMTGLYPAGHGIRENARVLAAVHPVVAEALQRAGYRTAAFVSSFTLARRFGLNRGFDVYDDRTDSSTHERRATATVDAALAWLASAPQGQPLFVWVHFFDPHAPYDPPARFLEAAGGRPYYGEVAYMDSELARTVEAFQRVAGPDSAVILVGDHGEGLGEHGERYHGNLLYNTTVHVPLVVKAPGVLPGVYDRPVSTRHVFHTLLDLAGLDASGSLRAPVDDLVLGEAMKPFLSYGWQPQVMAVRGARKLILAGRPEFFDPGADPGERSPLAREDHDTPLLSAARDYPAPAPEVAQAAETLDAAARRDLASLGYVSPVAAPVVRKDAPRPTDMVALFPDLDHASDLFVSGRYRDAVPVLTRILTRDATNLDAVLRLATCYSMMGQDAQALKAFERALTLAPESLDVRTYLAAHYARGREWQRAVPLLESAVAVSPSRVPALEALAVVRERQERPGEALDIRLRLAKLREPSASEWGVMGLLAMQVGRTAEAVDCFERERQRDASGHHNLELGVLYLAARRYTDARDALDRVPGTDSRRAMLCFKRAQVSVLLNEADRAARVAAARRFADGSTREMVARERLFQGL